MRARIQLGAAFIFTAVLATGGPAAPAPATLPTTRPAPTAAAVAPTVPEKHEPVALPPPPTASAPTPAPAPKPASAPAPITAAPVVHRPTTQPVTAPPPAPVPPIVKATTQPGPIDDKAAYAMGLAAGRRIRERIQEDGRTADPGVIMKGVIDGMGGRDPAYSEADMKAAFAEFQAYTLQRRADKQYADNPNFRKQADDNMAKSRAVLDQNAEMAQVDTRPDGVQFQELNPGTGRIVGNAKTLTVKNLRVSLADGSLIKNTDGDQTEKLAAADALPSLMDVVRGIRVGTKCRIWLPPDKAYGLTGKPPEIGPNEAIEYEFELVAAD